MEELITFGLAFIAYLMLASSVLLHAYGKLTRVLPVALAVTVSVHVGLVWALRFGWSISFALEKSVPGFVIFHGALALIIASTVARRPWMERLLLLAFPIVTAGASGAVFRYEYVEVYRYPLLVTALVTVVVYIRRWMKARG